MKKHKYIITGATGKIGSELIKRLDRKSFIVFTRSPKKLNKSVQRYVIDLSKSPIRGDFEEYDTVIHLAAATHIERCEKDRNKRRKSWAWVNNVVATKNLSEFCKVHNKKLIMLSTESVFGGCKKIYSEKDKTSPKSWYGITKLEAERVVQRNVPNFVILRTVMAYGGSSSDLPRLIVEKLKNGSKINLSIDQKIAFTYIGDIINALLKLSQKNLKGLYHFCGPDVLTPFDLGVLIAKRDSFDNKLLVPKTMEELHGVKGASLRLKYAVLSNKKFIEDVKTASFTNIRKGIGIILSPTN